MANRSPAVVHGSSLRQAYTLTEQGQFTEALQVLDYYLQESPQDKRGWVLRAHVMLTMGNPEGALDSIERVTHIDPADPMPWVIQGTALSTMGDYASALHSLDNALVADPENRDAHDLRRAVLERVQMQEQELQRLQLWYELGELQYRLGRHEDSLPNLDRSLRDQPSDAAGWGLKACVLWALGRQQEAVECIGHSITLRGEDDWAYGVRGTMLKDLGQFDAALADIDAALRINPAREDLAALRGVIQTERQTIPVSAPLTPAPMPSSAIGGVDATMRVDPEELGRQLAATREEVVRRKSAEAAQANANANAHAPATTLPSGPAPLSAAPAAAAPRPADPPSTGGAAARKSGRLRPGPSSLPGPANAPQAPPPSAADLPLEQVAPHRKSHAPDHGLEALRHAMEEAHHCYGRNDYRAAAALYEKIADQAAQSDKHMAALAALYRARCHYALREFEPALACYEMASQIQPNTPSWLEHGLTLRHLSRFADAMKEFDRCIQAGQNVDTAWVQKGHCALHLKQTDVAVSCYQHATESNPKNGHAWISLAQSLALGGQLQGAYDAVTRGLTLDVKNASGLELLGDLLCLMGRLGEARAAFDKAMDIEPNRTRAKSCSEALKAHPQAVPELVTKRFPKVTQSREKTAAEPIRARPTVSDRLVGIRAMMSEHRYDEAWAQLEKILKHSQVSPPELATRATLLVELGRFEDALAAAKDALRLDLGSFEAHFELGRAMAALKRYADALREVEFSIKARPRDSDAWALRGLLKAHLGDPDESKRCFEAASSYGPENANVLVRRATAMDVLGYPESALDLYRQALRLAPKNADALAEMAVTLAALGRRQEARSYAEEALQLNPHHVTAREWLPRLRQGPAPEDVPGRPAEVPMAAAPMAAVPSPPSPRENRPAAARSPKEGRSGSLVPSTAPIIATRKHTRADLEPARTDHHEMPSPMEAPSPAGAPPIMTTRRRMQNLGGISPTELLRMARDSYDKGAFEDSIQLYDQVIRADSSLSSAWYGKGLCLAASWQFEEARECLDRSSRLAEPPTEQLATARKRLEALVAFYEQSIKPLLAKELRAWRIFVAPSGAFRVPYPSWCQTFPSTTAGELAHIADRNEKPTFVFTVTAQPFVDARELTMVKHGERVVDEGELPHPQAVVDYKEVRDRAKGTFCMRAVLIKGHMAWYLVGTARFHYYAGYRQLFMMMVTDFFLA